MSATAEERPIESIECYAGYRSDQRPIRFTREGREHRVTGISSSRREPDREVFSVVTESGEAFTLRRYLETDRWTAEPARSGKGS